MANTQTNTPKVKTTMKNEITDKGKKAKFAWSVVKEKNNFTGKDEAQFRIKFNDNVKKDFRVMAGAELLAELLFTNKENGTAILFSGNAWEKDDNGNPTREYEFIGLELTTKNGRRVNNLDRHGNTAFKLSGDDRNALDMLGFLKLVEVKSA